MKQKQVGVLFSGGLDSTYLIYKNLKEGNYVRPYYIEIENNENKVILEKNRTKLLIEEFKKEFPNQISNMCYGMEIHVDQCCGLRYTQMPIWMLGLLFFQEESIDEFHIGYVCGDDMISYLDDIKKIHKSYDIFTNSKTKLKFPLSKTHKMEMYDGLPKKYLSLTVTCENPKIKDKPKTFVEIGDKISYNEYYSEKDLISDDRIIDYEPCGCCDPCKKILGNYSRYYGQRYEKINLVNSVNEVKWNYYKLSDSTKILLENLVKEVSLQDKYVRSDAYQLEIPFNYKYSDEYEVCEKE